ncbi:hypothetical protein FVE85_7935 [Porphyridium purpureum]|uniref:Uncharacterized protein n=1 Tax=Porphyridium purpureum TaxID=35688 RepID=A0A5J4YMF9_PORPP|nr:hypothetical protein FVE85_7935 [Porphyridium purpureum]|eukprot:POR3803..scf295_9
MNGTERLPRPRSITKTDSRDAHRRERREHATSPRGPHSRKSSICSTTSFSDVSLSIQDQDSPRQTAAQLSGGAAVSSAGSIRNSTSYRTIPSAPTEAASSRSADLSNDELFKPAAPPS